MTSGIWRTAALEGLQSLLALPVERDVHEHIHREAGLVLVDEGGVAVDEAGFLQRPHASQAGGLGQAHLAGEQRVGDAGVLLQEPQDGAIVAIELHGRNNPSCAGMWNGRFCHKGPLAACHYARS